MEEELQTRSCAICKKVDTRTQAALGHDFEGWRLVSTADCSTIGLEENECTRCGYLDYKTTAQSATHELSEYKRTQPTCTQDGRIFLRCACHTTTDSVRIPHLGGHKDENEDLRCDTCEEALHLIPVHLVLQDNASAEAEPYAFIGEESGGFAKVTMGENSIIRTTYRLYAADGYAGNVVKIPSPSFGNGKSPR